MVFDFICVLRKSIFMGIINFVKLLNFMSLIFISVIVLLLLLFGFDGSFFRNVVVFKCFEMQLFLLLILY